MSLFRIQLKVEDWGLIKIARALPRREDDWGCLGVLRGTVWQRAISVVSGEDLSHALHGYSWPLLRKLSPPPEVLCRLLTKDTLCARLQDKSCHLRDREKCHPGSALPICYQVPDLTAEQAFIAHEMALALGEGCYILVTEGVTFSL